MELKEQRDLLLRAIGAVENPDDLTEDEQQDLLEDLQAEADRLNAQMVLTTEAAPPE